MGLNAILLLMKDGPDREIPLEVSKCLFYRHQLQIHAPQLGGVGLSQIGA